MERGASCSSSASDSSLGAPAMYNFADKDCSPVVRIVCMRVGALAMKHFADQVGAPAVNNFANKAVTLATKCFAGKVGALTVNNFANDVGTLASSSFADKIGSAAVNNFADKVGALAAASFMDYSGAPVVNNFGDGEASCVGDQDAGADDAAVANIEGGCSAPAVNNFADEIGVLVPRVAQVPTPCGRSLPPMGYPRVLNNSARLLQPGSGNITPLLEIIEDILSLSRFRWCNFCIRESPVNPDL